MSPAVIMAFVASILIGGLGYIGHGWDREAYAHGFIICQNKNFDFQSILLNREPLFALYVFIIGKLTNNAQLWFLVTAFIYVFNYLIFAYKLNKKYHFIIFLMILTGFAYHAYGVNTLRAGLACSFVAISISNYKRLHYFLLFAFIAYNIHHSVILPILAAFLAKIYNRTGFYLIVWVVCLLLSILMGNYFENFFQNIIVNERAHYLSDYQDENYSKGFKIDFILYSAVAVLMGWFYTGKKKISDDFYNIILNTYIISNAFWLLIIRVNYSDRFAYLSWFLYPVVLIYPVLKYKIWQHHANKVALIVLAQSLFTYLMFIRQL